MSALVRKFWRRGERQIKRQRRQRQISHTPKRLPKNNADRDALDTLEEAIETLRDREDELVRTINDQGELKRLRVDPTTFAAELYSVRDRLRTLGQLREQYEKLTKARDTAADYSLSVLVAQNVQLMLRIFQTSLTNVRHLADTSARVANAFLLMTPYLRDESRITPGQIATGMTTFRNAVMPSSGEIQRAYERISTSTARLAYALSTKLIREYADLLHRKQLRDDQTRAFYDRLLAWMGLAFDSDDVARILYGARNTVMEVKARLTSGNASFSAKTAGAIDALLGGPNRSTKTLLAAAGAHVLIRTVVPFAFRPSDITTLAQAALRFNPAHPIETASWPFGTVFSADAVGVNNLIVVATLGIPALSMLTSWFYTNWVSIRQNYLNWLYDSDLTNKQAQVLRETEERVAAQSVSTVLPTTASEPPVVSTIRGQDRVPGERTVIDNILTFYAYAQYTQELATFLECVQPIAYEELKQLQTVAQKRDTMLDSVDYTALRAAETPKGAEMRPQNAETSQAVIINMVETRSSGRYAVHNSHLYRYLETVARATRLTEAMIQYAGGLYLPRTQYAIVMTNKVWADAKADVRQKTDALGSAVTALTQTVDEISQNIRLLPDDIRQGFSTSQRWRYLYLLEFYRCAYHLVEYVNSLLRITALDLSELEVSYHSAYIGVTRVEDVEGGVNLTKEYLNALQESAQRPLAGGAAQHVSAQQRVQFQSPMKNYEAPIVDPIKGVAPVTLQLPLQEGGADEGSRSSRTANLRSTSTPYGGRPRSGSMVAESTPPHTTPRANLFGAPSTSSRASTATAAPVSTRASSSSSPATTTPARPRRLGEIRFGQ